MKVVTLEETDLRGYCRLRRVCPVESRGESRGRADMKDTGVRDRKPTHSGSPVQDPVLQS